MRLLQNHDFDAFEACFIRFESNSRMVTPSVMSFIPERELDNNHEFFVVLIVRILMSTKLKSILIKV